MGDDYRGYRGCYVAQTSSAKRAAKCVVRSCGELHGGPSFMWAAAIILYSIIIISILNNSQSESVLLGK